MKALLIGGNKNLSNYVVKLKTHQTCILLEALHMAVTVHFDEYKCILTVLISTSVNFFCLFGPFDFMTYCQHLQHHVSAN